jgi:HAMP domain-containing protein
MKILTKFNLIFVLLFGTGLFFISRMAYDFLMDNARSQVLKQAELMMASAKSTRDYTSEELKPLLVTNQLHTRDFLPQTVPAYGATSTFSRLRKNYPEYVYKEASINPTNLRNRAVDWESDVVNYFRNNPEKKEFIGERDAPTGRTLYLARPISVAPSCLECHSVPSKAPRSLVKAYGRSNGFGWKENEVIAAQVVSVPMAVPVGIADRAFRKLVGFLVGIFIVTLIVIDAALVFIVIRPVRRLADTADRISKGELDVPELPVTGKDEIAGVTTSFNRMYRSLVKAFGMLSDAPPPRRGTGAA